MDEKSNQFVKDMFNYIAEDCKMQLKSEWLDYLGADLGVYRPSENVFTPEIGKAIRLFAEEEKKGKNFVHTFLARFSDETVSTADLKKGFRKRILKIAEKCISDRDNYHAFFAFCGHVQNIFLDVHGCDKLVFLPDLMAAMAEVLILMLWNMVSGYDDYNEYAERVNDYFKAYGRIMS